MHTKNKLLKKLTKNIDILPDVGTHIQFFYFVIYIYIHTFNTYDRIGVFVAQKKKDRCLYLSEKMDVVKKKRRTRLWKGSSLVCIRKLCFFFRKL